MIKPIVASGEEHTGAHMDGEQRAAHEAIPLGPDLMPQTITPQAATHADGGDLSDAEFPTSTLPGIAGRMAEEIVRVTTSRNIPLAGASVLGTISASLGAGLVLRNGGERRTLPNMYMMPIASSGTGKGESFALASKPFDEFERAEIAEYKRLLPDLKEQHAAASSQVKDLRRKAEQTENDEQREAMLEECKEVEAESIRLKDIIDSPPRYKVGDVTKEALGTLMQGQPGHAISSMSSEARGILAVVRGRYSKAGGDEDFYCAAYSGDSIHVDRVKGPPVYLPVPCLSAVWLVQPDAFRNAMEQSSMTESGLLPRFIAFETDAEPVERRTFPAPIPQDVKDEWAALVGTHLSTYRANGDTPREVQMTSDAADVFLDYENENVRRRRRAGDLHDLASYVARWSENAAKLALILHAARYGGEAHAHDLDGETARDAVTLMRWFSAQQIRLLSPGRNDRLRKRHTKLLAVLADVGGEMTLRELRRSHSFDESEVQHIARVYPGSFRVLEKRPVGGGRPSMVATTHSPSVESPGISQPGNALN